MKRSPAATVIIALTLTSVGTARVWTNRDGTGTFEGELVRTDADIVHVRNREGATFRVPLKRLSKADCDYVRGFRLWTWTGSGEKRECAKLVRAWPNGRVKLRRTDGTEFDTQLDKLSEGDQQLVRRFLASAHHANNARAVDPNRGIRIEEVAKEQGPRKWFLAVGVDDYVNDHVIPDLSYCGNDAAKLAEAFINLGYDSVTLLSAATGNARLRPTRQNVQLQLDALLGVVDADGNVVTPGQVGPGDTVVLAFSGHGVYLSDAKGKAEGFLCSADADLKHPDTTMLAVSQVYEQLARSRARLKVLLVDACRNEVKTREVGQPAAEEQVKGLSGLFSQTREGIVTFSSCALGNRSVEADDLKQGVFSYFLVKGLLGGAADRAGGDKDAYHVRLLNLFTYAENHVRQYSQQRQQPLQKPKLSAAEVGNESLGTLAKLREKPPEATPGGGKPVTPTPGGGEPAPTTTIDEDFSKVAAGELPKGWTGPSGAFRVERRDRPCLIMAQSGLPRVALPPVSVHGEFTLELEFKIPKGYFASPAFRVDLEYPGRPTMVIGASIDASKFVVFMSGAENVGKGNWPDYMKETAHMRITHKNGFLKVFVKDELFQSRQIDCPIERIRLGMVPNASLFSVRLNAAKGGSPALPWKKLIDDDFSAVPDGELPPGWNAEADAMRVERKDGFARLIRTGKGLQAISLPEVSLPGDFIIECEFRIHGSYGKSPAFGVSLTRGKRPALGIGALIHGSAFVVGATGMPDVRKSNWDEYMPHRARMRIARKDDTVNVYVKDEVFQTVKAPEEFTGISLGLEKGTEVYSIKVEAEPDPPPRD